MILKLIIDEKSPFGRRIEETAAARQLSRDDAALWLLERGAEKYEAERLKAEQHKKQGNQSSE